MPKMKRIPKTMDKGKPYWTLRYASDVPLDQNRRHGPTMGHWKRKKDAAAALAERDPVGLLGLEVVKRRERILVP